MKKLLLNAIWEEKFGSFPFHIFSSNSVEKLHCANSYGVMDPIAAQNYPIKTIAFIFFPRLYVLCSPI